MELSTLLLVVVAIVASVAVAFWVANITFQYTGFEVLDVSCRVLERRVIVSLRNRGTGPVRIIAVVLRDRVEEPNLTLNPGEFRELEFPLEHTGTVRVEVRTSRQVYSCLVEVKG